MAESASMIMLCDEPANAHAPPPSPPTESLAAPSLPSLSNMFARSRTPSPAPMLAALPLPPAPRRMVVMVVGLKPHRKLWTTSARPGESVINYLLLNGCPALVVPVRVGTPLVAWDSLTLGKLWKMGLPREGEGQEGGYEGIVSVLYEYLDMCVDWGRVVVRGESPWREGASGEGMDGREALRESLRVLVGGAIRSRESSEVKKEVDEDRSGIAMWRIP